MSCMIFGIALREIKATRNKSTAKIRICPRSLKDPGAQLSDAISSLAFALQISAVSSATRSSRALILASLRFSRFRPSRIRSARLTDFPRHASRCFSVRLKGLTNFHSDPRIFSRLPEESKDRKIQVMGNENQETACGQAVNNFGTLAPSLPHCESESQQRCRYLL